MLLALPEVRAFRDAHPRMQLLARKVETDGLLAGVATFQSLRGRGRIDVVFARDCLAILGIYPEAGE
jgi:hypothetical protein